MTTNRNNFLILGAVILSLISSGISIVLTARFTSELGAKIGLASIFLMIGIVLDLTKHISPLLALNHLREKQMGTAALITSFFIVLTMVSIVASADALSTSLSEKNSIVENSIKENAALSTQISALKETKANLVLLAKNQEKLNQITAMGKTSQLMANVDSQLIKLLNKESADKKRRSKEARESLSTHAFSPTAIYSFAAVIELISVLMSVSAYTLSTRNKEKKLDVESDKNIDTAKLLDMFGEICLSSNKEKTESNSLVRDSVTTNVENKNNFVPSVVREVSTESQVVKGADNEEKTTISQHSKTPFVKSDVPENAHNNVHNIDDVLLLKCQHNDSAIQQDTIEIKASLPMEKKVNVYKLGDDGSLLESSINEIKDFIRTKQIEPKFRSIDSAFNCTRATKNRVFEELISDGVLMKIQGKKSLFYTPEYA